MTEKQVKNTYKHYDEQFKKDIVAMLDSTDRPIGKVADEVGVNANTLRNWKEKYSALPRPSAKNGLAGAGDVIGEIVDLKRELARVTRQRDILKKALSILSENPNGGF